MSTQTGMHCFNGQFTHEPELAGCSLIFISPLIVRLGGRVVRTLDLRSIGREFDSWPLRY